MSLTTSALMARYAVMTTWMGEEGLVNAMWDAILNRQFKTKTGDYIIGPEVRTIHNEYRADLVVYKVQGTPGNLTRNALVVYEGKKATEGEGEWPGILTQCKNWASKQTTTGAIANGECVWFVGACGPYAKIWACKRSGTYFNTRALKIDHNGKWSDGTENNTTDGFKFDLADPNGVHQTMLEHALIWAFSNQFTKYGWTNTS